MLPDLDLDVRPGEGLGMFELGSSLWDVLELVRQWPHRFPQVEVKFDPDVSALTPIVLYLRPHLDLLFSGKHQRLRTICLRKLRDPHPPVTVRYGKEVLSSQEDVLRRLDVTRKIGPTYPGDDLRYPGIWFSFEDDGLGKGVVSDRMQEVRKILVSQKGVNPDEDDALGEVTECTAMDGDIALALAKVHDGVVLYFHPSTSPTLHVKLGQTTAQDLNLALGPPLRTHYKEDERMSIHSSRVPNGIEPGYFYNYFQHGIDFFINGRTHVVQKIILHSNIPGSPLFHRYKRCNWEIEGQPEDDEDDAPPRKRFHERFETISHFINPHGPPASMVLDRTDEDENLLLQSATTRLHGYDGVVLEVLEGSQVTAVILF